MTVLQDEGAPFQVEHCLVDPPYEEQDDGEVLGIAVRELKALIRLARLALRVHLASEEQEQPLVLVAGDNEGVRHVANMRYARSPLLRPLLRELLELPLTVLPYRVSTNDIAADQHLVKGRCKLRDWKPLGQSFGGSTS